MKYFTAIITCCAIMSYCHIIADDASPFGGAGSSADIRIPFSYDGILESESNFESTKLNDWPIIIHYGLNDSHSRGWVREDADGAVGICYFQRYEGNYTDGILIYKAIHPDGSRSLDTVIAGTRMEKSILLFDALSDPHIFVAQSDNSNQLIEHYYKGSNESWQRETIYNFYNVGGKFIYELSADTGPDGSFHLLILKTRSDIDSDDWNWAWLNSNLYHMTNEHGYWENELISNYNMGYTYDVYIKTSCRQDIKVDSGGFVHVVFREQIYGYDDPSRLWYATNKSGYWEFEIALNNDYGIRDDAGWFPSLCLDNDGVPYISCMYVHRVYTRSAVYCKLFLLKRLGYGNWATEIIADHDDGYYASDGRSYTGGLSHLIFDKDNVPHIIFSDIASAHWGENGSNALNVGNIRYAVLEDGVWNIRTIYHQPKPDGFYNATEMHGMCLIVSDLTDSIRVIGEEMEITGWYQYTSRLVEFSWADIPTDTNNETGDLLPDRCRLFQNYPNPFNQTTIISYDMPRWSHVTIEIFNLLGQRVSTLVDREESAGSHMVPWDGRSARGELVSTGVYLYRIRAGDHTETKKMVLQK